MWLLLGAALAADTASDSFTFVPWTGASVQAGEEGGAIHASFAAPLPEVRGVVFQLEADLPIDFSSTGVPTTDLTVSAKVGYTNAVSVAAIEQRRLASPLARFSDAAYNDALIWLGGALEPGKMLDNGEVYVRLQGAADIPKLSAELAASSETPDVKRLAQEVLDAATAWGAAVELASQSGGWRATSSPVLRRALFQQLGLLQADKTPTYQLFCDDTIVDDAIRDACGYQRVIEWLAGESEAERTATVAALKKKKVSADLLSALDDWWDAGAPTLDDGQSDQAALGASINDLVSTPAEDVALREATTSVVAVYLSGDGSFSIFEAFPRASASDTMWFADREVEVGAEFAVFAPFGLAIRAGAGWDHTGTYAVDDSACGADGCAEGEAILDRARPTVENDLSTEFTLAYISRASIRLPAGTGSAPARYYTVIEGTFGASDFLEEAPLDEIDFFARLLVGMRPVQSSFGLGVGATVYFEGADVSAVPMAFLSGELPDLGGQARSTSNSSDDDDESSTALSEEDDEATVASADKEERLVSEASDGPLSGALTGGGP